jgi:hypothetical protein
VNDYRPKYYELLSPSDQERYDDLRAALSSQMCRNRRGKRLEGFSDMLASIRAFCIRDSEDDWKRCLVCGVCWLSRGIAINNRQLSLLLDKCKSSINGSLQKMGYSTLQSRSEGAASLLECMPMLKNNFSELREWTVRLFVAATPQPNLPMYSVNTLYPFQSPAPSQYHTFWTQPRVMSVAPTCTPAPVRDARGFFDDEFALPPTFIAHDVAGDVAPVVEPREVGEKADLDLVDSAFDPFGIFGDKW